MTVVLLGGIVALFTGERSKEAGDSPRPNQLPRINVLVVVLDTVRADRLGAWGNERGLTPRLDELASESAVFVRTNAHAPWTLPSMASLYTSTVPRQHGAVGRANDYRSLDPALPTLAETFLRAGYSTAAVTNVQFLTERFEMARGFDHVDSHVPTSNLDTRRATPTVKAALSWLDANGERPFFLLVHFFDAHLVYDPPPALRRRLADPRDQETESYYFGTAGQLKALREGEIELSDDQLARLEMLYDAEVAAVDAGVGQLLDGLASRDLDEDTIVIVVADHGEEFGEHGGFEHGHSLYQELLHVPFLLRAPGFRSLRVREPVGLIDVAPTLCALAGLETPSAFEGRSLAALLRDTDEGPSSIENRPVWSEAPMWGPPTLALLDGQWKMIAAGGGTETGMRLYDLQTDPREQIDLAAARPEIARRMLSLARELGAGFAGRRGQSPPVTLDEEERERLRSLGYVH
jgi:arylsulfatase A-like enzyme